jgi:hypothetical protein
MRWLRSASRSCRWPPYSAGVAARILGTGVLIRLATVDEARAVERARRGFEFTLEPERSSRFEASDRPPADTDVYAVSQVFVDFADDRGQQRWVGGEHHGWPLSTAEDATLDLLRLAEVTAEDGLIDMLGDMGIAGLGVSRWAFMSAPRTIELTPELEARLAPLRRR